MFTLDTALIVLEGVHAPDLRTLQGYDDRPDQNGNPQESGWYGSSKVTVTQAGTLIVAQLPSHWSGSNAEPISLAQVRLVLEVIAAALGLPPGVINDGRVYRLDIAVNLSLTRPTTHYLAVLAEMARMARIPFGQTTVVFRQNRLEAVFYDPLAKRREKRHPIHPGWDGLNVLRYELRFLKGVAAQLGQPVYVRDLWDEGFYLRLVDHCVARFQTVRFNCDIRPAEVTAWPGLQRHLALLGMEAVGGLQNVIPWINDSRQAGVLETTKASKIRGRVRDLAASNVLTLPSAAATELSEAVHEAAALAKSLSTGSSRIGTPHLHPTYPRL